MKSSTGALPVRRRLGRITVTVAALGLAFAAAGTGLASARTSHEPVPYGYTPFVGSTAVAPAAQSQLSYHGGFIQDHVQVYLVFWGKQWTSDGNGVQSYVTNFFKGLGTSADHWSTVTSQYTGKGGHPTFGTSVLKGTWVDTAANAPGNASSGAIGTEAKRGLAHFGVAASHNVSVIVLSPHGTHPNGFPNAGWCAWHSSSSGVPFTNMPYVLDAGTSCGANSVRSRLDGFSIVAGHEYSEAVTDPFPASGWVDASGAENADKCAWQHLHTISLGGTAFAVQPTWSNSARACAG
jgi:hypothetical protein